MRVTTAAKYTIKVFIHERGLMMNPVSSPEIEISTATLAPQWLRGALAETLRVQKNVAALFKFY